MDIDPRKLLHKSLYHLMVPLAQLSLNFGISVKELFEIAKKAYVDVARDGLGVRGRPTNKSRIAAITGLTRQEVNRLLDQSVDQHTEAIKPQSLQRVVNYWLRDPTYLDSACEPLTIVINGPAPSFEALAAKSGGDVPYQTLIKELKRLNIVEQQQDSLSLLRHGYLPSGGSEERIPFLGSDAGALIHTISHNLLCEPEDLRVQRKVAFDRLSPKGVGLLEHFAATRGQEFLEELDRLLAPHQLPPGDANAANTKQTTSMVGLGLYVFNTNDSE